jgi:hypothetical protein
MAPANAFKSLPRQKKVLIARGLKAFWGAFDIRVISA